ncbi:hypothetical protein P154DRAFT_609426 [Amniculicola lignicola CBS 123094]|uniref:Uncharacterized protein n=1 Tax=Amniculicola lignicola CBS 123094 TaxID=1392246 RepID=A0A6A5W7N7_9PLEO|nr:hypothetical protein P154DRAFT_609426 [Amniculicola lignicola CBS 123094]
MQFDQGDAALTQTSHDGILKASSRGGPATVRQEGQGRGEGPDFEPMPCSSAANGKPPSSLIRAPFLSSAGQSGPSQLDLAPKQNGVSRKPSRLNNEKSFANKENEKRKKKKKNRTDKQILTA